MTILSPVAALAFITTFILVSATPGMCMALSFSLGMSIGVRRAQAMMSGELVGVALVAIVCGYGASSVMKYAPSAFSVLKVVGGVYLLYVAAQMWQQASKPVAEAVADARQSNRSLAIQGFVTAVANPKAWAFFSTVLIPFINAEKPIAPQLIILVSIILVIEFFSLCAYAYMGQSLRGLATRNQRALRRINQLAAACVGLIGIWLAVH